MGVAVSQIRGFHSYKYSRKSKPVQRQGAVLSSSAPAHLLPSQTSSLGWHSHVYNWIVTHSREEIQLKITSRRRREKEKKKKGRKNKDDFAIVQFPELPTQISVLVAGQDAISS